TLAGAQAPAEVLAYVKTSHIAAVDALTVTATSNATVVANVDAGSVALAGGAVAIAAAGAGADVQNKVSTSVMAYIDGNRGAGINVLGNTAITAQDTSSITATAAAASVSGSVGL